MSKIKINWGTGLVIGMLLFIGFIMYFVVTMLTDSKYNHDLVVEEYYKQELVLNSKLEARANNGTLTSPIRGKRVPEGWLLEFPEEMNNPNLQGTVFLYRPSNKQLDFELPLEILESNLLIPENRLLDGRWNISITWSQNGKEYLYEEEISF